MKILSLCSGIGGLCRPFGTDVIAYDINKDAVEFFNQYWGSGAVVQDITTVEVDEADLVVAGFPCQPFSIAGNRLGFNDHRGNIFSYVLKTALDAQAKYLILENVKNLISHDGGNTFKVILDMLRNYYHVTYRVINATEVGVPQNRERIFIVASKVKLPPISIKPKSITPYKDFLDSVVDPKYIYCKSKYPQIYSEITNDSTIYQWRRTYVRANAKGVCPTLTHNMGTGGHNVPLIFDNGNIRKLTPSECMRLQGFDIVRANYKQSDSKLYQLAGNAVNTHVASAIAEWFLETI